MANKQPQKQNFKIGTKALGDSGNAKAESIKASDVLSELQGTAGLKKYRLMAQSDSQVGMVLRGITSVIRSATWDIVSGSEDFDVEVENSEIIKNWLFESSTITFSNLLGQLLDSTIYGFSVFEKVYTPWDYNGSLYLMPELKSRVQTSISNIDTETNILTQKKSDGTEVKIPFEYLVFFILDQRGSDVTGTSMLRNCYLDWRRKESAETIDNLGITRNAVGIPTLKVPNKVVYNSTEWNDAEDVLEAIGTTSKPYMLIPNTYEFNWVQGQYNSEATQNKINRHNAQIAKSLLLQFLELGQSGSGGSYALGDTQSQLFLNSIQYVANMITSTYNRYVIQELYNINFGIPASGIYPKLAVSNINKEQLSIKLESLVKLTELGYISPVARDEDALRKQLEMGELTEEEKEERNQVIDDTEQTGSEPTSESSDPVKLSEAIVTKMNVRNKFLDKNEKLMKVFMKQWLTKIKNGTLINLKKIIDDNGNTVKGLSDVKIPFVKEYKAELKKKITYFFQEGRNAALDNAKGHNAIKLADIPNGNFKELPNYLKVVVTNTVEEITEDQIVSIKINAVLTTQKNMIKGMTAEQSLDEANRTLLSYIDGSSVNASSQLSVTQSLNTGQMLTNKNELSDVIVGYKFVAVIDEKTTDLCKWLNGKTYSKDSAELSQVQPSLHYGCRSFMLAIFADEGITTFDNVLPPPSIWKTKQI